MIIDLEDGGRATLMNAEVEVSLTWLNDECHLIRESIIESVGEDLILCLNRRCLNVLKRSGNPYCVICGAKLG